MRLRKSWFPVLLALMALSAPVWAADIGRQMEQEYGVISRSTDEGARLNDTLDEVVSRMTEAIGLEVRSAKLLGGRSEKKDKVINAFALPDGRIYVTLGLMREAMKGQHPDAALAFVVGHEITHVKERHSRRQQRKTMMATILGAAGAALLGARGGAIADWGSLAGGVVGSRFSRVDEYRADKGGLLGMQRAGFDMDGAVELLEILQRQGGEQNRHINGLLGSHPITRNRIARIKEMMDEIEKGQDPETPTESELKRDDQREKRE